MDCRKVEKMLSNYLDNSQDVTNKDEIKQHIAQCQKCTDELNTMLKLDNLLKLKVKEKPSKEYWENYWPKLESKLDRNAILELSENRSSFNRFVPNLAFTFNGVIIALLIFLSGLLYINTQQLKLLQSIQEEMQTQMGRDLFHLRAGGMRKENVQILDRYHKNSIIYIKLHNKKKEV